uniref:Uncharacterized protein n=1 Tax=Alexandrium catenella TaxID=2925 RepID=A0A7S1MND0_ALECA|mmetsp:Transcript_30019/g.81378  ORF Transcript_30019/g.81378 Transcript_30019/m.81378 type:complete len:256 (+) Transcript_30019:38-805(+)
MDSCGSGGAAGAAANAGAGGDAGAAPGGAPAAATAQRGRGTALGLFLEERRAEHAANGISVPLMVLQQEFRRLSEAERRDYESRASQRRGAGSAQSTAEFLRRQQEQRTVAVRKIDPNEAPAAKRSRAAAAKEQKLPPQVPRPAFPVREQLPAKQSEQRRREAAETLRVQAEGRGAQITVASSHRVDLKEISRRLSAPTLSCDWGGQPDEEEAGPDLEVELPAEREARGFLRQELGRRVSSARLQSLVQARAVAG